MNKRKFLKLFCSTPILAVVPVLLVNESGKIEEKAWNDIQRIDDPHYTSAHTHSVSRSNSGPHSHSSFGDHPHPHNHNHNYSHDNERAYYVDIPNRAIFGKS